MQAKSKSSFPLNIHRFEITSKYNQNNENNLRKEHIQQLPRSINGKCFINLPNLYKTDLNFSEEQYWEHLPESWDVM